MAQWKRNLIVVMISQFLSAAGFMLVFPFIPYYFQELGVVDSTRLKLMSSLFLTSGFLGLALVSPFWGIMADRFGRRLMLLRAGCMAALTLAIMGVVTSVEGLILLRFAQGLFSGTVPAAQAFVATEAPIEKSGRAMGLLSTMVFSGMVFGPFAGGIIVEQFGFSSAFFTASGFLAISTLLIFVGTQENFPKRRQAQISPDIEQAGRPRERSPFWPITILVFTLAFTVQLDSALFPLLIQEIHGGIEGAAYWVGIASALVGVAGMVSGIAQGRLADRHGAVCVSFCAVLAASALMIPHAVAEKLPELLAIRFALVLCVGGVDPVFQSWLAKITAWEKRGSVFGWASSVKSLAWTTAPLAGGILASLFGLRFLYYLGSGLLVILAGEIIIANESLAKASLRHDGMEQLPDPPVVKE